MLVNDLEIQVVSEIEMCSLFYQGLPQVRTTKENA